MILQANPGACEWRRSAITGQLLSFRDNSSCIAHHNRIVKLLIQCLAVGTAGFFGAIARFLIGISCGRVFPQFPVGTLIINLSGSFILGLFSAYVANRAGFSQTLQFAVGVGFVGAYTTFSTFMYESDNLIRQGALLKASANLVGSIVLGLVAVRLGILFASK